MGKAPLSYYVREWIAGIAFSVFLWAVRMTQEEYFDHIVRSSESDRSKNIFILIARVSPKESEYSTLTAKHYYTTPGTAGDTNAAIDDFRESIDKDGREIRDMLAYVLTEEDLKKAAG